MSYSNGLLSDQSYQTANKYVQRGLPGVGFKLTDTGDYDMQNKKLVNVDEGENNQDVVNKHQLDVGLQTKPNKTDVLLLDGTSHMVGDLDLRGNKIILPGEIQMDRKLITNLDTDENQDLSAVNMITLKNKVEPKADKDYVDFEITKQNALINNTFVKKTGDQMSSIGDGGSGPCCAKNPTQKKTGLTGNPKVKYFRNVKVKFPKVKWETTKKPEKTGFNRKK